MGLLLTAAMALLGFRLWSRMRAMETTVAELTERVWILEGRPAAPVPDVRLQADQEKPCEAGRHAQVKTAVTTSAEASVVKPDPTSVAASLPSPEALETQIGSRWLLYVGVIAIVVGVSYFEKLAIENDWISEIARVIQGAIAGFLLIGGGLFFVGRGQRTYGQILTGSGVAILYVSTYAAFNFYHLISQPVAFALMSAVTTLGAWLASRHRSQALALVAVSGGFATPFLLPTSTDAQTALFGYETILIAGIMFVSRHRDWPMLNVVSYLFTILTFAAWADRFYTADKYLTTQIFLTLFCGMFLYMLRASSRSNNPTANLERLVLWTAPLLYYAASLINLGGHFAALLVYFVGLSLAGVIAGLRTGSWIRLTFWAAVAVPLVVWSGAVAGGGWLTAGLTTWTAVYVLNLAGLYEATVGRDRKFRAPDIALLHLNGLGAYVGAYLLIETVSVSACGYLAIAGALLNGALAWLVRRQQREEALHFGALGLALLTIAIALKLEGPWITSGWAAEGAVLIWLGLRERRDWLRAAGLVLFSVAIGRLLALQFSEPLVGQLPVVNPRALSSLFVIALACIVTWAHHRDGKTAARVFEVGIGLVVAKLLVLAFAASEIVAYWKLHAAPPFEPAAQLIDVSLVVGAGITWLGLQRRQEWIRAAGGAVVALAALSLFGIQLQSAPAGYVTILNGRALAGVLAICAAYVLAIMHKRKGQHLTQPAVDVAVLTTSASLLTLSLVTSEIDAFWSARGAAQVWSVAREGLLAIARAGIGALLIWRGLANRRFWVRAIGASLLGYALVGLLQLQFTPAAASYVVVANPRVVASAVMIAVLYGLASLYRNTASLAETRYAPAAVLWLAANVLTLTLLTSEITAYWQAQDLRHSPDLAAADSHFAREMMLSVCWAAYATLLVVVGLKRKYAPIRYLAMTLFVVTIAKVFVIDLAELDRIYRVLSVIGLGVMLLLTSYLYQKLSAEPKQG